MCQPNWILLFTVLLVPLLTPNEAALEFKRFLCDSSAKVNKLKKLEFEKILAVNQTAYLIAKTREVFKFKIPIVYRQDDQYSFRDSHQEFRWSGPFYEAKLETALPIKQTVGYYLNGSTTSEVKTFKRQDSALLVEFNDINVDHSFALGPLRQITIHGSSSWTDRSKFRTFFWRKKSNSMLIMSEMQEVMYIEILKDPTSPKPHQPSQSQRVGFNHDEPFFLYDEALGETSNHTMLSFQQDKIIHICGMKLNEHRTDVPFGIPLIHFCHDASAVEFFGCPTSEIKTKPHLLKGIFCFDNTFFLFINHCHLKIKKDLVENEFNLTEDLRKLDKNFDNVGCLQTRDVDYGFENIATKYVKTIRGGALLVLSAGEMYELAIHQDNLAITPAAKSKYAALDYPNCQSGQTLSITSIFFCFNETTYQAMPDSTVVRELRQSHQIADLFTNMDNIYPNGEVLQYTFGYRQEEFVMMTKNYLFVIPYKAVRVDMDSYQILLDDRKFVRRVDNRMFGSPKQVSTTTTIGGGSTDQTKSPDEPTDQTASQITGRTSDPYSRSEQNLITLFILGIFGLFILLMLVFYVVSYSRKQTRRSDPHTLVDLQRKSLASQKGASNEQGVKSRLLSSSNQSNGSGMKSGPFVPSQIASQVKSKNLN